MTFDRLVAHLQDALQECDRLEIEVDARHDESDEIPRFDKKMRLVNAVDLQQLDDVVIKGAATGYVLVDTITLGQLVEVARMLGGCVRGNNDSAF